VIELSSRHAPAIAILLALAVLPAYVHRGSRFLQDDCRDPAALLEPAPDAAQIAPPVPEELLRLPRTRVASRRIAVAEDVELDLYVIRAFNPTVAYRPSELYFFERKYPDERTVEVLEHGGERIPVHRAYYDRTSNARRVSVVGYVVVFDAKPVEHVYGAQIRAGPEQLFTGRKPFWVLLGVAHVKPRHTAATERALHEALTHAWEEYRAACLP
jgi:hypothetical protein